MSDIEIVQVFEGMPDYRRKQGRRHSLPLCLALLTLAVASGNQGFLVIGDWLKYHEPELTELFGVKNLPSYSSLRRVLLISQASVAKSELSRLRREIISFF